MIWTPVRSSFKHKNVIRISKKKKKRNPCFKIFQSLSLFSGSKKRNPAFFKNKSSFGTKTTKTDLKQLFLNETLGNQKKIVF